MKHKRKRRCSLKAEPDAVTARDWKKLCGKLHDEAVVLRRENRELRTQLLAATVRVERVGAGDGPGGQT